jgi:putative MATE family efflux protein
MDAVRGRGGNPMDGPVDRAIVMLAVPMVLEMVMESIFAIVDIFFVSRLGSEAVAAVGLTESLLTIVYTVAMGLSIGVTAMVARRTGERDPDGAADAAVQAILLGLIASTIFAVLGILYAEELLVVMGGEPEVVATGLNYARVSLGTNGVIMLLFLINAAFRGAGEASIAMRVLWFANAINLVLDPCLIFGIGPFPELGVTGAAVATSIGRGSAVLVQLATLFGVAGRLSIALRHVRLHIPVMLRLIRLSGTGTFQVFVGTASWIVIIRILSGFGSAAIAGYTIAMRIILFALMPAWGLSNAAATMVGQGLGAGDVERAERSVWIAGRLNFFFLGGIGMLFIVLAPFIVSLFGGDAETANYAIRGLRTVSAGFFFYAYGMVLTQSFNGAGDTWTPTWLSLICFWLFELPLAWVLSHTFGLGPLGVFVAITLAFSAIAVAAAWLFRRGRWKTAVA